MTDALADRLESEDPELEPRGRRLHPAGGAAAFRPPPRGAGGDARGGRGGAAGAGSATGLDRWAREAGRRGVAFLLPGVGDQYPGLARGLYRDEPVFRREIDLCAELLLPHLGLDLREVLFAAEETAEDAAAAGPDLRALLGRRGRQPSGMPPRGRSCGRPASRSRRCSSWAIAWPGSG